MPPPDLHQLEKKVSAAPLPLAHSRRFQGTSTNCCYSLYVFGAAALGIRRAAVGGRLGRRSLHTVRQALAPQGCPEDHSDRHYPRAAVGALTAPCFVAGEAALPWPEILAPHFFPLQLTAGARLGPLRALSQTLDAVGSLWM